MDITKKFADFRETRLNLAVLCLVAMIEGADIQLLPASFRAMEVDLQLSPSDLALLTLFQGCTGAISGPVWACLADNGVSRRKMLSAGAAGWGVLTLALACVQSFYRMAALRMLNGVALGMMLPVLQSLVADSSDKSDVGFKFGCLQFYTNFGQVFGAVAVTSVSNQVIFGIQGWRLAFAVVAVASIFVSVGVSISLVEEPRPWRPERISIYEEFRKFWGYLKIRSFLVVVIQGMFGMIPWAAMSFLTMFFQYLGFSDSAASTVYGMSIVGTALGGLVGGVLGDRLAAWSPHHGRVFTAQLTILLGIPLVLLIFLWVPYNTPPAIYAILCFTLGIVSSWACAGCNRPIFTEIVPPCSRASAMAWEITFESTCGFLLGPAAVGLLAQHYFGYRTNNLQVSEMSTEARLANARALGHGLAVITVVPWVLCALCYTFLHKTLPEDMSTGLASQIVADELSEKTPLTMKPCAGLLTAPAEKDELHEARGLQLSA